MSMSEGQLRLRWWIQCIGRGLVMIELLGRRKTGIVMIVVSEC